MNRAVTLPLACSLLLVSTHNVAHSQTVTAGNVQAAGYAASAVTALTGNTPIRDVILTGSVTWNGKETGTATLKALGASESRLDFSVQSGDHTEIRDLQTGTPLGQWTTSKAAGGFAYHNCWTDGAWFFPALGYLKAGTNSVWSYIGLETRDGVTVQHIQVYLANDPLLSFSSPPLSTTDFYLNATTMLPVAMTFNVHPDNDENVNLKTEVRFSSYQNIEGVSVPMRIQRYQQGTLIADIAISNAVFNSGVSLSAFAINNN